MTVSIVYTDYWFRSIKLAVAFLYGLRHIIISRASAHVSRFKSLKFSRSTLRAWNVIMIDSCATVERLFHVFLVPWCSSLKSRDDFVSFHRLQQIALLVKTIIKVNRQPRNDHVTDAVYTVDRGLDRYYYFHLIFIFISFHYLQFQKWNVDFKISRCLLVVGLLSSE